MADKRPTYGKRIAKLGDNGYLRRWNPNHPVAFKDGTVLVHREVWYDNNGAIPEGYHVHHKNKIRTDNRIENLELHSNRNHQLIHQQEGKYIKNQYGYFKVKPIEDRVSTHKYNKFNKIKLCKYCGNKFTGKRKDAKYCQDNCRVRFCKDKKLGLSQFPPN